MDCPKCGNRKLVASQVGQVEVDKCKSCGGIWCDHNELADLLSESPWRLKKLTGKRPHEELNLKKADCPRDGRQLMRVYSAGGSSIVLDSCPQCQGIWLDGGELDALLKK
jgi:Zn-finger nucleic acid-binding protein